jgi:hypothetical protein
MNHERDQERDRENVELDSFEASLRERFQRQTHSAADEIEASTIWNAMHAELQHQSENVGPVVKARAVPSKDYFTYRNMLACAVGGLLVAFSSVFLVAAKQRSDGTVLSTTTHVERMMPRNHRSGGTRHEWLPEEREIWEQLMKQTAGVIDPDSTVVIALSIQQK